MLRILTVVNLQLNFYDYTVSAVRGLLIREPETRYKLPADSDGRTRE